MKTYLAYPQLLLLLLPLIPWWFNELTWPFWGIGHVKVGLMMKVGSIISVCSRSIFLNKY